MYGRSGLKLGRWISRWLWRLIALPAAAIMLLTGVLDARSASSPPSVTGWIRHHAIVLGTVDPAAPLYDLAPLGRSVGNAKIVGLGESVHGAAQEAGLDQFAVDLRTPAPPPVRSWLHSPIKTRGFPIAVPAHTWPAAPWRSGST
jgi:hypothetical protein